MSISDFIVTVADSSHIEFAKQISSEMASSAKVRGTGIAQRTPEYLQQKMIEGKAVIAFSKSGQWAGFTYIESWEGERYVANSGLIINPSFRGIGLAKIIKRKAFALSLKKFKGSVLFGLTTGLAVMKINSSLGYYPTTFSQLTNDQKFWAGCKSCINYPILEAKNHENCLCTAMIFNSQEDRLKFDVEEVLEREVFNIDELKLDI